MIDVVYDTESFPNFWCCGVAKLSDPNDVGYIYEISDRRNDAAQLCQALQTFTRMFGFNNMSYDWPMLQYLLDMLASGNVTAADLWSMNERIFASQRYQRHEFTIWQPTIPQVDLFAIHHLDRFKVGLKQLQMTMRSPSVRDIPVKVGEYLTSEQMDIVCRYNAHDVNQTKQLVKRSWDAIAFRETLGGPEWLNYNDGKIGTTVFKRELKEAGVKLYERLGDGRIRKRQTFRQEGIPLADVIFPYIQFTRAELEEQLFRMKQVVVDPDETRGGFHDVFNLDGFKIDVKLGGIHGSVSEKIIREDGNLISDFDVTSYYPSIAIVNGVYPEHLGYEFCRTYDRLKKRRVSLDKNDPARTILKYALNVPFGESNNPHDVFYDPKYMLTITINGQLMLIMLAEQFANVGIEIVQVNTDGVTIRHTKNQLDIIQAITRWWQRVTAMELEKTSYTSMYIRDANNYIAIKPNGERKRKGVYDWTKTSNGGYWRSNHSELIVPKAAEAVMCDGADLHQFITNHKDAWDFLLFRKGKFELGGWTPPKNLRYYVSQAGDRLVSIYPPLAGKTEPRRIGVHTEGQAKALGSRKNWQCSACARPFTKKSDFAEHNATEHSWKVTPALDFDGTMPDDIDFRYYIQEAEKLILL